MGSLEVIVLDTHVLIWWINQPEKLSVKSQKTITNAVKDGGKLLVSSISIWEIYLLFKKDRLEINMDIDAWVSKIERIKYLEFVPVNNAIGAKSVMLPNFSNRDPADRIIVATAREYGAMLVTSDQKIRKYSYVKTIW